MKLPCLRVADIELPETVGELYELAYNFWWSWNPRAGRLFDAIDSDAWSQYRNPVQLLINVDRARWERILQSETFLETYNSVVRVYHENCSEKRDTWFQRHHGDPGERLIAYFSCEYGLDECFNIYSGGLGILSGDHCKAASDLGLPFVAVGLLYRRGYFRQAVDADGRQQHSYPTYDFTRLPVRPVASATQSAIDVPIELPGRTVYARVWVAQVGRVPLILLDTDISRNDSSDRPITSQLYVRGREMRLVQEKVLGVGGVRALRALGLSPTTWHINEGHSAFLQLERLREMAERDKGHRSDHMEELRRSSVFTTHTPVPAGNEQFNPVIVKKYFLAMAEKIGLGEAGLMELGNPRGEGENPGDYNLTALAIRTSAHVNGVSQLHAKVSDGMWHDLLQSLDREDAVKGITNGVHVSTWLGPELLELYNRELGLDWRERMSETGELEGAEELRPEAVWRAHVGQKHRLSRLLARSLREQLARHGRSPDELRDWVGQFDPDALTIGFARRFATYKRASLIFSDMHRIRAILADEKRPVQIVIAGKAHPADHPGQELIQSIYNLSQTGSLRGKVFFIEDYDMRIGRTMVQGVDVWLNTPLRPMEASGTSGQKAGANGVLNFSILDGWWPEAHDERCGWAIGAENDDLAPEERDRLDAASLYETLEEQILPLFYDRRDDTGLPVEWIERMKHSMATITPHFSAGRMVRDYVEWAYAPTSNADRRIGKVS